jgi:hypothetical protein
MGVLDKVRKFRNRHPKPEARSRTKGIYLDWQDGPNPIRLTEDFKEVRTHFLAGVKSRGDRGLCLDDAFTKDAGDNRIPKVINCLDWDIDNECEKEEKTCPVCKLYRVAKQALEEGPEGDEEEYYRNTADKARSRVGLKWYVFDRDNPNVTIIGDGDKETKQKGLKIATLGMEAYADIEGILQQVSPLDITDSKDGLDINVIKGHNGHRVSYSAQVVVDGKGLKVTPFDEEEDELFKKRQKLVDVIGRQTDSSNVLGALHGDLRELVELGETDDDEEQEVDEEADAAAELIGEMDDDGDLFVDDDDVFLDDDRKKKS